MNKKKFESPKLEIIHLQAVDIITTSTDPFDGQWVPIKPTDKEENYDFLD